eukprot:3923905-Prymnesium_polylepis.2
MSRNGSKSAVDTATGGSHLFLLPTMVFLLRVRFGSEACLITRLLTAALGELMWVPDLGLALRVCP